MFSSETIHPNGEKAVTGDYKHSSMKQSFSQGPQNQHITKTSRKDISVSLMEPCNACQEEGNYLGWVSGERQFDLRKRASLES